MFKLHNPLRDSNFNSNDLGLNGYIYYTIIKKHSCTHKMRLKQKINIMHKVRVTR